MNCKTGLSIFGCLFSLLLMIGSVSAQTVSISPNPVNSPANGQNFTVALNISGGRNVAGYQATINFDSSTLKYVSSTNGAYLPSGAFVVPAITDASSVTAAALALNGSSNGSGTLATVTFRVVSVKASTLRFSGVTLTDPEGRASSPSVVNAQVVPVNICKGDVNGDSVVNVADLALVASRFGQTDGGAADVNADGVVNVVDLALVASEFGESCASPSTASTPSTSANNTVAQTFEQNLLPILTARCAYSGCHDANGPDGLDFRTYQTFIRSAEREDVFVPGNARSSDIIEEIVSGRMPPGGPPLTAAQIQLFRDWINQQDPADFPDLRYDDDDYPDGYRYDDDDYPDGYRDDDDDYRNGYRMTMMMTMMMMMMMTMTMMTMMTISKNFNIFATAKFHRGWFHTSLYTLIPPSFTRQKANLNSFAFADRFCYTISNRFYLSKTDVGLCNLSNTFQKLARLTYLASAGKG